MSWQARARVYVANKRLATTLLAASRMNPRGNISMEAQAGLQREIFLDVPDNDAENGGAAWLAAKAELENRIGSQLVTSPERLQVLKLQECSGQ